jgi:hypothetical protein
MVSFLEGNLPDDMTRKKYIRIRRYNREQKIVIDFPPEQTEICLFLFLFLFQSTTERCGAAGIFLPRQGWALSPLYKTTVLRLLHHHAKNPCLD